MRLLPCHKGHRFKAPHWSKGQYLDIRFVGRSHVVAIDEAGKELIFDRDDMNVDWLHLGATPHPFRRKTDKKFR